MPRATLIDTDILIDVGRGVDAASIFLAQATSLSQPALNVISQMELIVGCRDKAELQQLDRFLNRLYVIPVNELITDKAIDLLRRYRLSHGLLIADALIAATAIQWELPLASKNQRDFRFIADLELLTYPINHSG